MNIAPAGSSSTASRQTVTFRSRRRQTLSLPISSHSREAAIAGSPRRKPWVALQLQRTSREAATARCTKFAAAASRLRRLCAFDLPAHAGSYLLSSLRNYRDVDKLMTRTGVPGYQPSPLCGQNAQLQNLRFGLPEEHHLQTDARPSREGRA